MFRPYDVGASWETLINGLDTLNVQTVRVSARRSIYAGINDYGLCLYDSR